MMMVMMMMVAMVTLLQTEVEWNIGRGLDDQSLVNGSCRDIAVHIHTETPNLLSYSMVPRSLWEYREWRWKMSSHFLLIMELKHRTWQLYNNEKYCLQQFQMENCQPIQILKDKKTPEALPPVSPELMSRCLDLGTNLLYLKHV